MKEDKNKGTDVLLEYIQKDEYVEVTPKSLRLRKIYLNENDRKRFKIA